MHTALLQLMIITSTVRYLKINLWEQEAINVSLGWAGFNTWNTEHAEAYRNNPTTKTEAWKLNWINITLTILTYDTPFSLGMDWLPKGTVHKSCKALTWTSFMVWSGRKPKLSSDFTVNDSSIITYSTTNTLTSRESWIISYPSTLNFCLLLFILSLLVFPFLLAFLEHLLFLVDDGHDSTQLVRSQLHVLFTQQTNHLCTHTPSF